MSPPISSAVLASPSAKTGKPIAEAAKIDEKRKVRLIILTEWLNLILSH